MKNARFLQQAAPAIMPAQEPPEGFGSIIPVQTLARLHQVPEPAALLTDPAHRTALEQVSFPQVTASPAGPMFHGTVYFAHITFIPPVLGVPVAVDEADMQTAQAFLSLAAPPISTYVALYGAHRIDVSPQILEYTAADTFGLLQDSYNDSQLQGWVNDIASQNGLSASDCVVVLNPPGVVNVDAQLNAGTLGYHGYANLPYVFVNVAGSSLTIADTDQFYAVALSHEIAEAAVDPRANDQNLEVCDPCSPDCQNVFVNYFDDSGAYIQTVQAAGWPPAPPPFAYSFCINAIVQPTSATSCPAPYAACAYPPPPPSVISGQVVDNESWAPISDASVVLSAAAAPILPGGTSDILQLSTGFAGYYETPNIVPQDYAIQATAHGYLPGHADVTVPIGVPVTTADFPLERVPSVISGWVKDTAMQPISDAALLFTAAGPITPETGDSMQLSTAGDGTYQTPPVEPQSYQVTAIQDGYAPAQAGVTVDLGVPVTTLNFVLAPPEPFTVKGFVESQAGKLLHGVSMTLEPPGLQATTDTSGVFVVTGMPPDLYAGDYQLTATLPGYMPRSVTFTIPNGATIVERLVLVQLGTLTGTVTSAAGGAPIPGATVTAGPVSAPSGPDGAYTLAGLGPGDTSVAVSAAGYDPAHAQAWIPPGGHATQDITMTPASAVVFGTVTGSPDGIDDLPLANATVAVAGVGVAHTDHTGSYTISPVPAGYYEVTATAGRCRPASVSIQIFPQQAVREDFDLFPLHEPRPVGDLPSN